MGLAEEARKLALDRFRLIHPHLEQNQSLQSVACQAGIPYRPLQRWVSQYRLFGLVALARKRREDRGERRVVSAKITMRELGGLAPTVASSTSRCAVK